MGNPLICRKREGGVVWMDGWRPGGGNWGGESGLWLDYLLLVQSASADSIWRSHFATVGILRHT